MTIVKLSKTLAMGIIKVDNVIGKSVAISRLYDKIKVFPRGFPSILNFTKRYSSVIVSLMVTARQASPPFSR